MSFYQLGIKPSTVSLKSVLTFISDVNTDGLFAHK